MRHFFLDLFFPQYCIGCRKMGSFVCSACFSNISYISLAVCPYCEKGSVNGIAHEKCKKRYGIDGIIPLVAYTPLIRKMVYQFKYPPYLSDLSRVMSIIMFEGLIQNEHFMNRVEGSIFTSIPLSKRRLRKRGYNHSELLSREIAVKFSCVNTAYLLRKHETKPQYSLTKSERGKNMKNAFDSKRDCNLSGKVIFVIDDIVASGSTFKEAARVLKRRGAQEVWGISFAKQSY